MKVRTCPPNGEVKLTNVAGDVSVTDAGSTRRSQLTSRALGPLQFSIGAFTINR